MGIRFREHPSCGGLYTTLRVFGLDSPDRIPLAPMPSACDPFWLSSVGRLLAGKHDVQRTANVR